MSLSRQSLCAVIVCLSAGTSFAALPSPWLSQDIGSPAVAGSADFAGGTFTVRGSGAMDDIPLGISPDKYHYAYREVVGEFTFTTRLVSMNYPHEKAKAGVMVRLGLSPTSPHVGLVVQSNGEPIKTWRWHQGGGVVIEPDCTNWPSTTETCRIRIDRYFYRDFPVWLRIRKFHHQVSVFISENGTDWKLVRDETLPRPESRVFVGMIASDYDDTSLCEATFDNVQLDTSLPINYTTSWLGNSFEGCDIHYIQHWIGAMYVKPDTGLIYCTGWYDEGGHTAGIYSHTGEPWGELEEMSFHTRYGMVATDDYVYCLSQHKWTGNYEPTGKPEFGDRYWIRRFHLDGSKAPFGGTDNWLLISENEYLRGIAANDTGETVYVSDTGGNRIRLVDTATMQIYDDWNNIYRPGPLAYDNINFPDGALWIVETRDDTHDAKIILRDHNGQSLPVEISGIYEPRGLAIHPLTGQLYVAEYGPDSQVLIYNPDGTFAGSFGVQGGVYQSTTPAETGISTDPGEIHPLKFNHPTGVGFDFDVSGAGEVNLYVATNGPPVTHDAEGTGSMLRKFHWNDVSQQWEFVWQRYGLEFVDGAFVEPGSDGLDVYTKHAHYRMDFTKTRGQEAEYVGFTVDPLTYPEDWRNREGLSNPEFTPQKKEHEDGARLRGQCAVIVRVVDGRRLMYLEDQHSTGLSIYRFQAGSEIAIPSGRIAREGNYQRYIWRDMDGQGDMDWNGEMEFRPLDPGEDIWGWWVDNNGDVWSCGKTTGVRRYMLQGFDGYGNPIYHFNNVQSWSKPSEFSGGSETELTRLVYDDQTDTLYLAGYTSAYPATRSVWGTLGREIIRYDNWTGSRSVGCRIGPLPYGPDIWDPWTGTQYHGLLCRNMAVAGDYVFVGIWADKVAKVYDKNTGQHVFDLTPGPEVGYQVGWIESPLAMSAYQRSNGEYLVFYHDEYQHKVLMYRFGGPESEEPRRLIALADGDDQVNLTWEDHCDGELHFEIERRTPEEPFEPLAIVSADATGYSDTGLLPGTSYIYHVRAVKSGGETSSYSWEASATTPDQPPASPSDLSVERDGTDPLQLNLTWTDHAENESGFRIERKSGGGSFSQVGAAGSASGSGSQVVYSDDGLLPATIYTYRVSAFNASGDYSGYSNEASAKTGWQPTCYTVDDADASIIYAGSWSGQTGWGGRYMETLHETDSQGAYSEFAFTGNTITLIAEAATYGGEAEILLDGVSQGTISFLGDHPPYQIEVFSIGGLARIEHTIRMVCQGSGWIYLDQIEFCITTGYTNVPSPPSGLEATAVSDTQLDLSWQDNAGDNDDEEDWYRIERKQGGGGVFELIDTVLGEIGSGTMMSYSDTGLDYDTTYIYRVYATNDIGDSGYSNEATGTTLPPPPPAVPQNIVAIAGDGWNTLSWDAVTEQDPAVVYYKIYKSEFEGGPYRCAAVAFGGVSIIDSSVSNDTTYYYRVAAVDSFPHESGQSIEVSAMPHQLDLPTPPVDFEVVLYNYNRVTMHWTDTSDNETGFRIERLTDGTEVLLSADTTGYTDYSVQPETTYQYKVFAYNDDGDSPEPNPTLTVTTGSLPVPLAPTNLTAEADSILNVIQLDWTDNATNETGYTVERRTTGDYAVVATLADNVVTYSDPQLQWQTTYTYRVRAYNTYGNSSCSNEATATTPIDTDPIMETVDDDDVALVYTGSWGTRTVGGLYGGSTHETDQNGAYVEFTFNGFAVDLIGEKQTWGGTVDVYIDDNFEQTASFYSPVSNQFQQTIFSITGLTSGEHTLKVVKTGGSWIYVDAVQYSHY